MCVWQLFAVWGSEPLTDYKSWGSDDPQDGVIRPQKCAQFILCSSVSTHTAHCRVPLIALNLSHLEPQTFQ